MVQVCLTMHCFRGPGLLFREFRLGVVSACAQQNLCVGFAIALYNFYLPALEGLGVECMYRVRIRVKAWCVCMCICIYIYIICLHIYICIHLYIAGLGLG